MNSDALSHWFEENGIEYDRLDYGAFALRETVLSNDTVREIGACNGRIRLEFDHIILVEDDE